MTNLYEILAQEAAEMDAEDKKIERVLKEKGIDGLTRSDKALVKNLLNHVPTTFDKELYKKLTYTEKIKAYRNDIDTKKTYDWYVSSIRYRLRGEEFKPYKTMSQEGVQMVSDGRFLEFHLETLLELEYELKQKYNEEGDK